MNEAVERPEQRVKRLRQRQLFDDIAELYESSRPGYPAELVAILMEIAGVGGGARVLEVGCGTGQLTRELAPFGLALTAIDIGPSMISAASRRVTGTNVSFEASSFEDLDAPDGSFDLIVSADAFHWIDPEVRWEKAARLLAPGGWIGLLGHRMTYDEPLGTALLDAWVRRSADGGAWANPLPTTPEARIEALANWGGLADSGLFGAAVIRTHSARKMLSAGAVLNVEHTRATTLSYDRATRASFTSELTALLEGLEEVGLEDECDLTVAQALLR